MRLSYPNILNANRLMSVESPWPRALIKGYGDVPSRPIGASYNRWRATWLVFTGRADALLWPGQGDQS
jgi:hypothetical protein